MMLVRLICLAPIHDAITMEFLTLLVSLVRPKGATMSHTLRPSHDNRETGLSGAGGIRERPQRRTRPGIDFRNWSV